jgi:glycosyltransferase involved in cell wall biosynthesis
MSCTWNKGVDFMKPLISIIMPIYNCNEFAEESIGSILGQTYTNWELIIVNDASTDNTEEIVSQIQDKRINLINLPKHQGLASAFKEGYKYVKGEFIIRHDGDDISAPTRFEAQVEYLEDNPKVGMVSCLISCFTRDQFFRKDCIFIEKIQNHYINYEEIKNAIIGGFIPLLFPTLMIRKELMDKINYDSCCANYDDHTELLLELLKLSPVKKIKTILYSYRRHKDAYHIANQKQYNQYTAKLLKDPAIKNHLQYRDFYKNLSSSSEKTPELNEKSELRVLMLIDALNVGGTETHVLNITKKLIDMGIYVVVATSGGPMEVIFKSYGIKVLKLPIEGDYIPNKKKFGMIRLVKTIIDEEKINLIHCHLFSSMQLASELYRMYKIPYVVTIHGLFYPNNILYSSCIKASSIIAVSEPVRNMLDLKLGNLVTNIVTVIPNGVSSDLIKVSSKDTDIRKELHIPKDSKVLCYCSRLDWNKTEAARVFLFSFSQLTKEFSDIHAVIVGDGAGKDGIEREAQIINEMTNENIVHVVGAKVNVIPYFLQSNIVIGTARVALEAMLCKKPVIAIGNHGYTGIIAEANKDTQWKMYFGDHASLEKTNVSRLVRDIRYLLYSSKRRKRIGEWGRAWCNTMFNNDKIVKEIIDIYRKSLDL